MKKLISSLLVGSLFLSFTTNVFAASSVTNSEDTQVAEGVELIAQANVTIDEKIAIAIKEADGLQSAYLAEIRQIEQSEIGKIQSEITKRKEAIASGKYSFSEVLRMTKEIADFELKIIGISERLERDIISISQDIETFMAKVGPEVTPTNEALYAAIEELTENLNKKSKKYETATDYYVKKLITVITDCYDVTLAISQDAIARAAGKGVQAECSWKLVRFGHLWVWIDPIKIIGRY